MTDATTPKRVIVYATPDGKEPFTDWLYHLRDVIVRKRFLSEFLACNKATMATTSQLEKESANCGCFSALAIGFILANAVTI